MRTLLALGALLTLLLAACSTNSGSTTSPTPTEAMTPSSIGMMASPDASPLAMSCDEAFGSLSASDLASIGSLADAQGLLDSTIAVCPTASDWTTAAQAVLPTVDLSQAEDFLRQRCAANDQLAATQICGALGS